MLIRFNESSTLLLCDLPNKTFVPRLIMRKILDKSQLRNIIPNTWPTLKILKVVKNKICLRNCCSQVKAIEIWQLNVMYYCEYLFFLFVLHFILWDFSHTYLLCILLCFQRSDLFLWSPIKFLSFNTFVILHFHILIFYKLTF